MEETKLSLVRLEVHIRPSSWREDVKRMRDQLTTTQEELVNEHCSINVCLRQLLV